MCLSLKRRAAAAMALRNNERDSAGSGLFDYHAWQIERVVADRRGTRIHTSLSRYSFAPALFNMAIIPAFPLYIAFSSADLRS